MDGAVYYLFRYEFTLAAEHEMRIGTISQEFVPLTLHRYITTRIVNVPSSERGSIRFAWMCAVAFRQASARDCRSRQSRRCISVARCRRSRV